MILYSKNGDFVGIGKDELSFLGFEDIDEFRNLHKDVADLFINRPGYIFKFKNFSWIDYTLHSGAPKKSAVIKLKNGSEVEVPLKIKEVFLYSPKDEKETIMYCVEFLNNSSQTALPQASNTIQNENFETEPKIVQENSIQEPLETQNFIADFETKEEEKENFEPEMKLKLPEAEIEQNNTFVDSMEIEDYKSDVVVEDEPEEAYIPEMKLKVDSNNELEEFDLNEETQESFPPLEDFKPEITLNEDSKDNLEIPLDDYKEESIEKLKIDDDIFTEDEKTNQDILSIKEEIKIIDEMSNDEKTSKNDITFDIVACAQELDLELGLIAELIEEYFEKIEDSLPIIESSIQAEESNKLKNEIYELKGISDNLHMNEVSKSLIEILQVDNKSEKFEKFIAFKELIEDLKKELI